MTGGLLPQALLCAALGLTLAFASRNAALGGCAALIAVAVTAHLALPSLGWATIACWLSVAVTVTAMYWPQRLPGIAALLLSVNAGLWVGLSVATPLDLARTLPMALLAFPGAWLAARGAGVALKVVASWLVAVAVLAVALPLVSTPAYVSDHRE